MDFIKLVTLVVEMLIGSLTFKMTHVCVNKELFAVDMYKLACDARMHGYYPVTTAVGLCTECGLPHPFFHNKADKDRYVSACGCGKREYVLASDIQGEAKFHMKTALTSNVLH